MAPGRVYSNDDSQDCATGQTPRPTVYMIDKFHPAAVKHAQTFFDVVLPSDPEIHNWQANAEYLLVKSSSLPASTIQAARRLRAIGKQGVGIDRIDQEACKQQGIEILNTPGVNANAVAELTLGLAIAVARNIGNIQQRLLHGQTVNKDTCSGLILTGKTLGLIGMGNIGKAVARMFRGAFAAEVVAYDPFLPENAWSDLPHRRAGSVDEVLAASDVLSIHVPLTPDTKGLISYEQMQSMKPTAIIVNASRGGIVDEDDLVRAIQDGLIWGAGLDCHELEPPTLERYSKHWSTGQIISTPHIGAATSQTQMETAMAAVDRLYAFSNGNR